METPIKRNQKLLKISGTISFLQETFPEHMRFKKNGYTIFCFSPPPPVSPFLHSEAACVCVYYLEFKPLTVIMFMFMDSHCIS